MTLEKEYSVGKSYRNAEESAEHLQIGVRIEPSPSSRPSDRKSHRADSISMSVRIDENSSNRHTVIAEHVRYIEQGAILVIPSSPGD
jgi:hypothetical protein